MIKNFLFLAGTFFIVGCSSLQVATDYDPNVNIQIKNSFAIVHKKSTDSIVEDRINLAIKTNLEAKGYTQASQENADFDVIYEYGSKNKTDVESDFIPVGLFGGYTEVNSYKYTQGSFDIRMIDKTTKKAFWTAQAKNDLDKQETPQERTAYVNKIVTKILEKFPSKSK